MKNVLNRNMTTDHPDIVALLVDESFQRWVTGAASDAEAKQWREWLNAAPSRQALLAEAKKLWEAAQFQPAVLPDVEAELQNLQKRLKLSSLKTASIQRLAPQRTAFGSAGFSWKRLSAIAAAAVLLIALLWRTDFWRWPSREPAFQIVSTDYGQRQRVELPDGTTVVLNAHSTLRYPSHWPSRRRGIELRGEAYFDVASRSLPHSEEKQAFVVQTADGEIQVVGTRFVVYERNNGTRVVVEEGSVMVMVAESRGSGTSVTFATQMLLHAGQMVEFQKGDSSLTPSHEGGINLGFHTTWWRDDWQLDGTPFAQVIRRLEETYDVTIKVREDDLLQRKLSGGVENSDLEVIIKALATALHINVRRDGKVITFGRSLQND